MKFRKNFPLTENRMTGSIDTDLAFSIEYRHAQKNNSPLLKKDKT